MGAHLYGGPSIGGALLLEAVLIFLNGGPSIGGGALLMGGPFYRSLRYYSRISIQCPSCSHELIVSRIVPIICFGDWHSKMIFCRIAGPGASVWHRQKFDAATKTIEI